MTFGELTKKIEEARLAYYGPGQPIMTDSEYDRLEEELRKAEPEHWLLKSVGAPPGDNGWEKVKHSVVMGSLNKAQTSEEVEKWAQKAPGQGVFLTEKFDGLSCLLSYKNGDLVRGATRGDGTIGEDITRNVSLMKGVQIRLQGEYANWSGHLRGEIVCLKSDHTKYFPGDSNPRNTASGTAKRQSDPEKCRHLTVFIYQVLPDTRIIPSKAQELFEAGRMGFFVPPYKIFQSLEEVETEYQRYIKERKNIDYDIDGLVLEFNDTRIVEQLGERDGRPKGAVAYKFPHEMAETKIEDVIWQVGNSGRITPVAIFQEVFLDGARITRASLHTAERFKKLKLKRGDRILVSRRNAVIPYVESNFDA